MATLDILGGELGTPVLPPCRVATTANSALSGLATTDGVALAEGDRVLVWHQTDPTQNGIWLASSGPWTRPVDAASNLSFVLGTLVNVALGDAYGGALFTQTCADDPVVIGTSNIAFLPKTTGAILETLPTTLPATAGVLWNNNGSVSIS